MFLSRPYEVQLMAFALLTPVGVWASVQLNIWWSCKGHRSLSWLTKYTGRLLSWGFAWTLGYILYLNHYNVLASAVVGIIAWEGYDKLMVGLAESMHARNARRIKVTDRIYTPTHEEKVQEIRDYVNREQREDGSK